MISNFLLETFGKTVYLTFVITEREGELKFEFISPVSNRLKFFFKSAGEEFYRIVSGNPKKIESIIIDEVIYYFSVERIRHGKSIHYGIHILYALTVYNEELFRDEYDFRHLLYTTGSEPFFENISDNSLAIIDKIRKNTALHEFLFDFYAFKLDGFFENKKDSYFYKINDVIKYTVENYFDEYACSRKLVVNYINSDMYTQINLNFFMFFMVNLFLTVVKYLKSTLNIGFVNNLKTLDIILEGTFWDGFFENNSDILCDDEWLLSSRHPAFSDFELMKCFANKVGASVELKNPSADHFEINVSVSKIDIVFSNLLRVNNADADDSDIPIYTVDIDDIIN